MHVKLHRLASEKHRFGPKIVSEAISQPQISWEGYLLRTYATTTNLTTSKLMDTALTT